MSNKKERKKNTIKKVPKKETIPTLKLDNNIEIPAKTIFMKNSKHFNISDIDINRIRDSKVKFFIKEGKSCKPYIFYEDGDKYVPLNICFNNMLLEYYNEYINENKNNNEYTSKTMNFVLDDDSVDKIIKIFEYIKKRLKIDLNNYFYECGENTYLKTKTYRRTCFNKKGCKDISINPDKNIKYECKPLLQIQSIYYVLEDKKHIAYYPQILIEQCRYKDFIEYNIAHKDSDFTDSEHESEKRFNDDDDDDDDDDNNDKDE